MKTIKGKVTISRINGHSSEGCVEVEFEDDASHVRFAVASMSMLDYAKLFTGIASVECTIEVRGLDKVGKRKELQHREIECPLEEYDRKELSAWLAEHGKVEGWLVDSSIRNRASYRPNPNGGCTLRYMIYRYVDEEGKA